MDDTTLELLPGHVLKIVFAAPIIIGRWPWPPFGIEFDQPQPIFTNPSLTVHAISRDGAPRKTQASVLHVYAVYEDLRALLVFPSPALWVSGDTARIVALVEK